MDLPIEAIEELKKLFSTREMEIVEHLLKGMTNLEIADASGLSEKVVKWNLTRIYKKLAVKSRVETIVKLHDVNTFIKQ